ncbi:metallophosphoesterase [Candidatus Bipolaricaulota bacterium]|nr:metallophosphoesterase [Candidatus Bipolaricaulota bacterium]
MKIGIVSDTHDRLPMIAAAVTRFNSAGVETVLHAGDLVSPIVAETFSLLACPLVAVFGNNDGDRLYLTERFARLDIGAFFGEYHTLSLGGREIVLMHQPRSIDPLAASGRFDLIVYGHTHRIDVRQGRSTPSALAEGRPVPTRRAAILNPGEGCGWLTGRATAAIVDLVTMQIEVIDLAS